MPANRSNKDVIADILKLDPKAAVERLKNPELEALLASLKAVPLIGTAEASKEPEAKAEAEEAEAKAKAEAEANAEAEAAEAKAEAEEAEAKAKAEAHEKALANAKDLNERLAKVIEAEAKAKAKQKPTYSIAKGKAVMGRFGIFGPGDSVEPSHFEEGDKSLRALLASGHVVES